MTEKSETSKEVEETKKVVTYEDEVFLFPRDGISVKAKNLEEAEKLYHQKLKETKESNND